jgi:Cysteine-rich CWC
VSTETRRLTCERCGVEFGCAGDRIEECWCNAEPYRLPLPALGAPGRPRDCLCPACLRAAAAEAAPKAGAAERG